MTARARPVYWIDAFTDTPLEGNPCAVVFDAGDLPEERRLAFTRETRLSECAFLQSSEMADFGVRYYLATGEIKSAGHPTIATVTALLAAGEITAPAEIVLEVGAGPLPVSILENEEDGGPPWIEIRFPAPQFGRSYQPEDLAPLVSLDASEIVGAPQTTTIGGTPFAITVLTSDDALARAELDVDALRRAQADGVDFAEPYLVALGAKSAPPHVTTRLLLPPPNPPEDPFTGSAAACLGGYLWAHKLLDHEPPLFSVTVHQGAHMGRPSRAEVSLDLRFDPVANDWALDGAFVTGQGVVLMRGDVFL